MRLGFELTEIRFQLNDHSGKRTRSVKLNDHSGKRTRSVTVSFFFLIQHYARFI